MALYFGFPNPDNRNVSEALKDMGLNYMKAQPAECHIQCAPFRTQPGFGEYVTNLPAFMKATLTQQTLSLDADCFQAEVSDKILFPVPPPSLCVSWPASPSTETLALLSQIGYTTREINKRKVYIVQTPSVDAVRAIIGTKPDATTAASYQAVNIDAFRMLMFVVKVFSAFFYTHCYPAYQTADHYVEMLEEDAEMTDTVSSASK